VPRKNKVGGKPPQEPSAKQREAFRAEVERAQRAVTKLTGLTLEDFRRAQKQGKAAFARVPPEVLRAERKRHAELLAEQEQADRQAIEQREAAARKAAGQMRRERRRARIAEREAARRAQDEQRKAEAAAQEAAKQAQEAQRKAEAEAAVQEAVRQAQEERRKAEAEAAAQEAARQARRARRKGKGGRRVKLSPDEFDAAERELRDALSKDQRLQKKEAAIDHLKTWAGKDGGRSTFQPVVWAVLGRKKRR
jgi:hypothetical protein